MTKLDEQINEVSIDLGVALHGATEGTPCRGLAELMLVLREADELAEKLKTCGQVEARDIAKRLFEMGEDVHPRKVRWHSWARESARVLHDKIWTLHNLATQRGG